MNSVQTWGQAINTSLLDLGMRLIGFLPALLGAVLILIIGFFVAVMIGKVVEKLITFAKLDYALSKLNAHKKLSALGIEASIAKCMGDFVKWFLVLVFLMAATEILGLDQASAFLNHIIMYIPKVVVATIILAIAFVLGNLAYKVVRSSVHVAGIVSASVLATISRWAIVVFGFLAALIQLGIATSLVNTLFIGFVAALSLALGLAFGLGGKDEAALILRKLREEITMKK